MTYAAGDVLVRAVMTAQSGLPADEIVNDFAFRNLAGAPSNDDVDAMFTYVSDFYRSLHSSHAWSEYISQQVNRSATHKLQAYTIVAGPLGSPRLESDWLGPVSPLSSNGLPTEVAAVLSFHADLTGVLEETTGSHPRARRRGRIYAGPLITGAVVTDTIPYRLNDAFLSLLRQAGSKLIDDSASARPWSVWSRRDATLRPVVGGWTDDAPDTQRRRGVAAGARIAWT